MPGVVRSITRSKRISKLGHEAIRSEKVYATILSFQTPTWCIQPEDPGSPSMRLSRSMIEVDGRGGCEISMLEAERRGDARHATRRQEMNMSKSGG